MMTLVEIPHNSQTRISFDPDFIHCLVHRFQHLAGTAECLSSSPDSLCRLFQSDGARRLRRAGDAQAMPI
jgi:hypothetical protein